MRADLRKMCFCLLIVLGAACGDGSDPESAVDDVTGDQTDLASAPETPTDGIIVSGFAAPESALHDTASDVYLVSNINGGGLDADDNGFISRVAPDGTVLDLKWIDGALDAVTLNAPKGMALLGDTLIVADIDVVRLFDRRSGNPLGGWGVEGATFLNDVAVAPGGTVYVSDTGVRFGDSGFEDSGTAAIHVFQPDGSHSTLEAGELSRINGLAVRDRRLYGVTYGTGVIFSVLGGTREDLPELPGMSLDGVIALEGGNLLVSDWDTQTVYLLRPNGSASAVAKNVESPADIGIDRRRNRVLIPGLMTNQVLLAPLPG
ncbi:MAG: hypothetical protein OEM96_05330 [Gemmatimonadota bacterium]|nr:hypothetical protein [Gemmatimonadota bacterium]